VGATPKDAARASDRFKRLYVACLEAEWSSRLDDRQTVLPLLELSERQGWIRFLHRRVRNPEDLLEDLRKLSLQAQYERYQLYAIESHGREGTLALGQGMPLSRLNDVSMAGRALYLGGCSVARTRALAEFKELRSCTGARAVCGYTRDVDWDESAAFELLLLSWLAYERSSWPLRALRAVGEEYAGLARRLGFVAVWKGGQWPRSRGK
jgi:hypothetical protein